MSQQLIDLSPDLKRLRNEGYEIEIFNGGHLIVRHIPYVNSKKEICYGVLVTDLTLASSNRTAKPGTHVIHFQGQQPCDKDGKPITAIQHSTQNVVVANVPVQHSFSNKPENGYDDYYHKVTTYIKIISAPAVALDPTVTAQTFKAVMDIDQESVLHFVDTNSSRANLDEINRKLERQKIAIVGLGGTGAYILDFIAKCKVKEIHLFDGDLYLLHNAFRSPGSPTKEALDQQLKKVHYYQALYSNFHKNIIAHDYYITPENIHELQGMNYVFLAVDKPGTKKPMIEYFLQKKISFIDSGMGVNKVDDSLIGILRVTTGTQTKNNHIGDRISVVDAEDDEYNTNIQIAELNALNAALAVIKWKKLCGFYQDLETEHHTTYSINVAQLLNEDKDAAAQVRRKYTG
jgi:hypothetical protein